MSERRHNPFAALTVLSLGLFMTLLDVTIVNVAIPQLLDSLGASIDEALWVINAYVLVLGVLLITAEYSTGMIRASMSAVPRRLPILLGKAVVYAYVTFALTAPASLIAFSTSQAILSGRNIQTTIGAPGVPRAVIGAALYLTVIGLFGLGLGAIVRNTAGGIAAFAGIMFVLPPLMNVLPSSWNAAASPYLPLQAGERVMALHRGDQLAPWTGFGVLCAYAAAALVISAVLLQRRDV